MTHLAIIFWSGVLTFLVGGIVALIGWLADSWGAELAGSALMMVGSLAFAGALLEGEDRAS